MRLVQDKPLVTLTAERISAREAKQIGLAHEVADAEDLDKSSRNC